MAAFQRGDQNLIEAALDAAADLATSLDQDEYYSLKVICLSQAVPCARRSVPRATGSLRGFLETKGPTQFQRNRRWAEGSQEAVTRLHIGQL